MRLLRLFDTNLKVLPKTSLKDKAQPKSTLNLLFELWGHLRNRRRVQLVLLLILMMVSGLAELLSLGAVLPFLAFLANPELALRQPWAQSLVLFLGYRQDSSLVLLVAVVFSLAAVFAALIRLVNLWLNGRLAAAVGSEFSCEAYRRTLYQPYEVHVSRNSSAIITGSTTQIARTVGALTDLLQLITAILVASGLLAGLLLVNWHVALAAALLFGSIYGLIALTVRKELSRNSEFIANASKQQIKVLQEGLGAIRDILLDGNQAAYVDIYRKSDLPQRELQARNQYLFLFPRYTLEAFGLVIIALMGGFMAQAGGSDARVIPLLGVFALGAQRLLPALQQVYNGWTGLKANSADLAAVLLMLNQPISPQFRIKEPLKLKKQLKFESVHYRYGANQPEVVRGLNLEICKGECIGIVGPTGSGKSTVMDILMGLLSPTSGRLLVDELDLYDLSHPENLMAWRASISHVPQSVFLADASIAENIAFGEPVHEIDMKRVRLAANQAQIGAFIEGSLDGYNAYVGERGIRLSGGQRQRLGIARALYKKAEILVLDEATSALDNETEKLVIKSIESISPRPTIIMVAHRLSTLSNCNRIVRLKEGLVDSILSPRQLLP